MTPPPDPPNSVVPILAADLRCFLGGRGRGAGSEERSGVEVPGREKGPGSRPKVREEVRVRPEGGADSSYKSRRPANIQVGI